MQYLEKIVQLWAQTPNVSDEVVILAAIEGMAIGQCASNLDRKEPKTLKELYEQIKKFTKAEEGLKRRKAARKGEKQQSPNPVPGNSQKGGKTFGQ